MKTYTDKNGKKLCVNDWVFLDYTELWPEYPTKKFAAQIVYIHRIGGWYTVKNQTERKI